MNFSNAADDDYSSSCADGCRKKNKIRKQQPGRMCNVSPQSYANSKYLLVQLQGLYVIWINMYINIFFADEYI